MLKRIIEPTLGATGIFVGLLTLAAAFKAAVEWGATAKQDVLMCLLAAISFWFGYRLLRSARAGRSEADRSISRFRAMILGIGSFIPGFVFSFVLICALLVAFSTARAGTHWTNLDPEGVAFVLALAFWPSVGVGTIIAIMSSIALLRGGRAPRKLP